MSAADFSAYARRYSELGWALIRLDGKKPRGSNWQATEPDEAENAAGKWAVWGEKHNMGVVLGSSGLAVVEADTPEALKRLKALLGGRAPRTPAVISGRGMPHLYFRDPGGLSKTARDGLELRLGRHQMVVPPSVHPDTGNPYVWRPAPWTVELAEIPEPLLAFFAEVRPDGKPKPLEGKLAPGERHDALVSLAGTMRRRGAGYEAILGALRGMNAEQCEPPKPDTELEAIARDAIGWQPEQAEAAPAAEPRRRTLPVQTWGDFRDSSEQGIDYLVDGLIPRGALTFLAAAPKAGKTWVALELAIAVALGHRLFDTFNVTQPRPVLYVALEGQRAALRDRIGCLLRGHGHDPDKPLDNLVVSYKPKGIDLADPDWSAALIERSEELGAALVIIDVLRRAARIREKEAEDFLSLAANLEPLAWDARVTAILHHYGKLSDLQKERAPAERMSGSGAMYGALDVGLFITGTGEHGRRMRVSVEARDLAGPDTFGLLLEGEGSGANGSLTYTDTARLIVADEAPGETDLRAPAEEIAAYIRESPANGRRTSSAIREHFDISRDTLERRRAKLDLLGIRWEQVGRETVYFTTPDVASTDDNNVPRT